jgi:hypothetical protein
MPTNPLEHLQPDDIQPLWFVFQNIDDSMLLEIANADRGDDLEAHLAALHAIRAGKVLTPMQWAPSEVLALTRWSELKDIFPDNPEFLRGHWMRLFCCMVLIRAAADQPDDAIDLGGEDSKIVQLIDSAMKLGLETSDATLRFLCWRINYEPDRNYEKSPLAIGILILCVFLKRSDPKIFNFLVDIIRSDDTPIHCLFKHCLKSQVWHDVINRVIIENNQLQETQLDLEIYTFGEELIHNTFLKRKSSRVVREYRSYRIRHI